VGSKQWPQLLLYYMSLIKKTTECCTVSKYQEAETQLMHTIRHVNDINQLTWNVWSLMHKHLLVSVTAVNTECGLVVSEQTYTHTAVKSMV